jgi:hypothetical protein
MSNLPPPYRIQRLSRILFWFGLIACALFGLAAASFLTGCRTNGAVELLGVSIGGDLYIGGARQEAAKTVGVDALRGLGSGANIPISGSGPSSVTDSGQKTIDNSESEVKPDPASTPGGG